VKNESEEKNDTAMPEEMQQLNDLSKQVGGEAVATSSKNVMTSQGDVEAAATSSKDVATSQEVVGNLVIPMDDEIANFITTNPNFDEGK